MSTSTTAPRARAGDAPDYEPFAFYDHDLSTRQTGVYQVQSSRHPQVYYRVKHHHDADVWDCPCPATVAACRHVRQAKQLEVDRWWAHLLATQSPHHLRRVLAVAEGRIAAGDATPDDEAQARACRRLLRGERGVAA